MTTPITHLLPYTKDCAKFFSTIHGEAWAMWLDSCSLGGELGRYDIIVARPHTTLVTRGNSTEVSCGNERYLSQDDPFDLIRQQLKPFHSTTKTPFPFTGGALGYLSYDLARSIESIPTLAEDDLDTPEMAVGIYDWALVCDHKEERCQLVSSATHPATQDSWEELIQLFEQKTKDVVAAGGFTATAEPVANMNQQQYQHAFAKIQHYLEEGDCYQVNFAQRFTIPVSGSPWDGYLSLRKNNPAPFGAYLNLPGSTILSSSPERFLKVNGDRIETRPIKGTRPRVTELRADKLMVKELRESEKDRAENLMIVDLLRNDLGKCCKPGSIRVPQLFGVEHYATVHHLVSVVEGRLESDHDAVSLMKNCFPGGSITGAPKLRAMEIIEELEPHRRGVYCGSILYIDNNGNMDSNIAIRTAIYQDDKLYFSAGGGIVRDSICDEEYQETYAKAAGILRIFDS